MRPIKFRAWNKSTDYMMKDITITSKGTVFGAFPQYQYILMQFTGLHDKNGKEIWEGDIVKSRVWLNGKDEGEFVGRIEYRAPRFLAIFEQNFEQSLQVNCEVIGNIYENPELMGE